MTDTVLHTDVGSVSFDTPLHEMRIAAVHRGAGPRGIEKHGWESFDGYLLGLATDKGVNVISERATDIRWDEGRPQIGVSGGEYRTYDLLVVAAGTTAAIPVYAAHPREATFRTMIDTARDLFCRD